MKYFGPLVGKSDKVVYDVIYRIMLSQRHCLEKKDLTEIQMMDKEYVYSAEPLDL